MDDSWMLGYIEGKRAAVRTAAEHYERNVKGYFDPHQVAVILRALVDIDERITPAFRTEPFSVRARPVRMMRLRKHRDFRMRDVYIDRRERTTWNARRGIWFAKKALSHANSNEQIEGALKDLRAWQEILLRTKEKLGDK